jgi:hypothetical protein
LQIAFFDIQVLNLDLLNQLNLATICVEHVVLAFRYGRHEWPVRHCFGVSWQGKNTPGNCMDTFLIIVVPHLGNHYAAGKEQIIQES